MRHRIEGTLRIAGRHHVVTAVAAEAGTILFSALPNDDRFPIAVHGYRGRHLAARDIRVDPEFRL
jgi:hypothetical protein